MKKTILISLLYLKVLSIFGISIDNAQNTFVAGDKVVLTFCLENSNIVDFQLIIQYSLGTSVISQQSNSDYVQFEIPREISFLKGHVSTLLVRSNIIVYHFSFDILANKYNTPTIESYCGPKHLITSGGDFTMITSTVLDPFDNPYPNKTSVTFTIENQGMKLSEKQNSSELYSYTRFYAPKIAGYGTVTSNFNEIGDESFRLTYYSHDPDNFKLYHKRQHQYADGVQLIEISTSSIKDKQGNQVGNGTIVKFEIEHKDGSKSLLTGESVFGVARVVVQAPDKKDVWKVSAYIEEFAQAKSIDINFLPSVTNIPARLEGSVLHIGPVKGFMGQFVKNQTPVTIKYEDTSHTIFLENGIGATDLEDLLTRNKQFLSEPTDYDNRESRYLAISVCGITKKLLIQ